MLGKPIDDPGLDAPRFAPIVRFRLLQERAEFRRPMSEPRRLKKNAVFLLRRTPVGGTIERV
jgi:hypothetical protein